MGTSLLETTLNTRELGGYQTRYGVDTKKNQMIRSDAPLHPSERDIFWLSRRQITTVVDVRGERERASAPSPFANQMSFSYHPVPIEEGSRAPESVEEVPGSYMKIAGSANISQVFRHMSRAPHGVLFHCAAGKDRTGVLSAIVLMLAGVSEEDIVRDYMMTKECNRERFALFHKRFPEKDLRIVIPDESYMIRFLQMFRKEYGDVEAYLQSIGISGEETAALRQKLVPLV